MTSSNALVTSSDALVASNAFSYYIRQESLSNTLPCLPSSLTCLASLLCRSRLSLYLLSSWFCLSFFCLPSFFSFSFCVPFSFVSLPPLSPTLSLVSLSLSLLSSLSSLLLLLSLSLSLSLFSVSPSFLLSFFLFFFLSFFFPSFFLSFFSFSSLPPVFYLLRALSFLIPFLLSSLFSPLVLSPPLSSSLPSPLLLHPHPHQVSAEVSADCRRMIYPFPRQPFIHPFLAQPCGSLALCDSQFTAAFPTCRPELLFDPCPPEP